MCGRMPRMRGCLPTRRGKRGWRDGRRQRGRMPRMHGDTHLQLQDTRLQLEGLCGRMPRMRGCLPTRWRVREFRGKREGEGGRVAGRERGRDRQAGRQTEAERDSERQREMPRVRGCLPTRWSLLKLKREREKRDRGVWGGRKPFRVSKCERTRMFFMFLSHYLPPPVLPSLPRTSLYPPLSHRGGPGLLSRRGGIR